MKKEKEKTKLRTKDEKELLKQEKEKLKEIYGWAYIDGEKIELANYVVEPAGLFMGRGKHPKRGCWKNQAVPEDIIINCTEKAPLPPAGHKWKKVVNNPNGLWTSSWKENVLGMAKRILLSRSSSIIQKNEEKKFDKARELAKNWDKVINHIETNLDSKDKERRMVATVCKLIADLAIRIGDEKGEDAADTVGASTLRKEHLKIDGNKVTFDFLGKDSIRYFNEIEFSESTVRNLKEFCNGKDDRIFPDINSGKVKEFLNEVFEGLTAKNFRTAKASSIMSKHLNAPAKNTEELFKQFKDANIEVAKFLNHKKGVSKNFNSGLEKMKEKIEELKEKKKDDKISDKRKKSIKKQIKNILSRLELKNRTKDISTGTSLTNYIDPRIMVSWCKNNNIDLTKVYTKTLVKKFNWADQVDSEFYKKYFTK